MIKLSDNALKIFKDLYSFHGENIEDTFKRVINEFVDKEDNPDLYENGYNLLLKGTWRPNTPTWLNAGTNHKIFSACYVVDLEDSMNSIYDIANTARKIFQYGSGVGIPVGNLREKDAYIYEGNPEEIPEGKSSGPITFMKLFDAVGETTKSGGRVRRAAILCAMQVDHPDIDDFINCKEIDGRLANMNISVNINDNFMQALKDGVNYDLVSPNFRKKVGDKSAQDVWNDLIEMSWKTADPGVIFIDTVNKYNPLRKEFKIKCCNPCGEQFLPPFSCCNLSAINLSNFVYGNKFDYDKLWMVAFNVMEMMDNVIDTMDYPDPRFKDNTLKYRQVGIGIMGLADAMYQLDLRYNGPEGRKFAGNVMRIITTACAHKSALLARDKGPFHDYEVFKEDMERIVAEHMGLGDSQQQVDIPSTVEVMKMIKEYGLRNSQFTTCMPTGTTALSCDASYGMEPCFGLAFQKNYIDGTKAIIINPIFESRFKNEDWYTDNLPERIFNNGGSLKGLRGIPKEVREIFVVAHDISYKDRIDMQSEIQKFTSNGISSTINLSSDATVDDISYIYKYAYEKGLKGVTIYRDGCKKNQPVTFTDDKKDLTKFVRPNKVAGNIYKVETGNGRMYVTIGEHNKKPVEVFIQIGKSGQIMNTFSEALGRIISLALQNGVPVDEVTEKLIGINSDKSVWFRFEETDKRPSQILSAPDGLAQLLNKYYSGKKYEEELTGEICEKCGSNMSMIEGCVTCNNCGNSKCS